MTAERVPTWRLEAGDVIRVRHHHNVQCAECLSQWETDAVVTEAPVRVSGRLAVNWAAGTRLTRGRPAVTGISLFGPDEQVMRIGRVSRQDGPAGLAFLPGRGRNDLPVTAPAW
jgi:hypothetical protein